MSPLRSDLLWGPIVNSSSSYIIPICHVEVLSLGKGIIIVYTYDSVKSSRRSEVVLDIDIG
jgi:hypothetical protein